MNRLSLIGLSKAYAGVPALRDVTLHLAAGRVHALMGENGAGKSTLIKLVAGVVRADRMQVERDGVALPVQSAADAARAGFRVIHQELNIVPQLSVAENILLGHPAPRRFGALIDWRALRGRAQAALDSLGAGHIDVRAQAGDLPTGDRMLMRIAGALVADPGGADPCLYVLDEPTASLTAAESDKLFAVIARLTAGGAAVVYVSHRMDEVMRICDDVTVLRDGMQVMTARIADTTRAAIITAMTGQESDDTVAPRAAPPGNAVVCRAQGVMTSRLRSVDFVLRSGEILGLAGLAEAGQREVIRLMLGQARIVSGTVEVLGAAGPRNPARAWARGVAYVPRERRAEGLMLGQAVRNNVVLPHLGDYGWRARKGAETALAADMAGQVHLRFRGPDQPVGELSGGNQQKVLFARALAGNPRLLLLEEPTRGVDIGARAEIHALIRRLSAQGCAVILSSSDLPELIGLSDRLLILRDGRQAGLIPTTGLTPAALLQQIYAAEAA